MRGGWIELGGVGVFEAADVAGELDAGGLHAETDSEVGGSSLAGEANGVEHAFDSALAEASGDEDSVEALELLDVVVAGAAGGVGGFEAFGFDPGDAEFQVVG